MYKLVSFTDIHFSDKNPISRKDDYNESLLTKIEQIRDFCIINKVDAAICGGDIFDKKSPLKNSHFLVSSIISLFQSFPCPVYSIIGNHDITQDNISNLPKQPIYTLFKSGALKLITDELLDNGNIRLFGVEYYKNPEYSDFNRENNGEKIQVCVAHVNASNSFSDLFGERVYSYRELSKVSPDIFIFGHYHPDQGAEVLNNKHFINVGSISRGSLKKDETLRIPSFSYIEIDADYNIQSFKKELSVLTADEIFDLDAKEKEEKEHDEMEKFILEMKSKVVLDKDENISSTVLSLNFDKVIKDRAIQYLERN